jgi:hypothetical protein
MVAEEELHALANPPHLRGRYPPALARMLHRLHGFAAVGHAAQGPSKL